MEKAKLQIGCVGQIQVGNNPRSVRFSEFYCRDVVKNGDDFVLKTVATIVQGQPR